jgi:hypothetical protein
MSKRKTVTFHACPCGDKRGFASEHDAEKALGRAKTQRLRSADTRGTRRGSYVENRYYECDWGSFHLTSESRKSYQSHTANHYLKVA